MREWFACAAVAVALMLVMVGLAMVAFLITVE